MSPTSSPLEEELDELLPASSVWSELRGARVFMTGGTGIIGCWLLETLLWADARFGLGVQATVLTRSPDAFRARAPHLAHSPRVRLHEGDVRSFDRPAGRYSHLIHAATETNVDLTNPDALTLFSASVDGTRHVLEFARESGVCDLMLVSSGAIYGPQPPELERISEQYPGAASPLDMSMRAGYASGKRAAEFLFTAYGDRYGLRSKVGRCFAFVGPYLPLDSGFAIGNFIADAMAGRDINIKGDGTPIRSYLYAADVAVWLWTILARGHAGRAYNIGAEDGYSILEVAHRVAELLAPHVSVVRGREPIEGTPLDRYVPCTRLAREELGLTATVGFDDAVHRTASWHRRRAMLAVP
ncbi:MAG TPA: NAD-dependent epimerase/dehydratase family protein [Gemmatimonadaceae bacterium]|jgi:dTDP-glucose 4,6-dehydratase|nr:NAD-dependent epimerase/dehydratase family protein [Gemmatimonadaceae bacterium]